MLEFVFAALLAVSIILGIIQIALVFNAHHMVQLAAFNAARAAIVARDKNDKKPDDPVDLKEMQDKAKLAAFMTLLPVIPDLHGALPTSLGSTPDSIQNLLGLNGGGTGGLMSLGVKALNVLSEFFLFINVKFVRVDQDGDATAMSPSDIAAMDTTHGHVEFDDRAQADNNLIKVVVTWSYPLVIPFANRIFFAAINPQAYAAVWIAAHPDYAAANPLTTLRVLAGDPTAVPVWGQGLEFEIFINKLTGGNVTLGDLVRRQLYRVPVKASYIMRMQWDRKP
jgi:hypothetical protein